MATALDNLARKQIYIPATQPETVQLRVAAYCRVSTDSDDQLNSFAAQNTHYNMEEMMIAKELHEKLNRAIATLPRAERELIKAIYFDELTEEKYAKRNGMSQTGVNYRHGKILSKLKMFLNVLGSFD